MKLFIKLLLILLSSSSLFGSVDFLMPNQAFQPYATVNDNAKIVTGIKLGKGIYIYDAQLKIEIINPKDISIKDIQKPTPVEHMGDMVYLESPEFTLTLQDSGDAGVKNIILKLSYQGCSEQGLCYEPYTKEFNLEIDTSKLSAITLEKVEEEKSETDLFLDTIKNSNLFIVVIVFFIAGVFVSLTPCVLPMVPILSGLIIAQGKNVTTKKAFALSVVYVLAMTVVYTIAGILAGLSGSNLQALFQTPWVVYSFAGIFVALAMSMFGFYELKLPDAIVLRASKGSNKGGFIGIAIMGVLSTLIVGPCVAAPLAGALAYIGQTGDAILGGVALFSMSIGMGVLLILAGTSAGKFMPKPGAWMTLVNATFGVIMLGIAIWMLDKVIAHETTSLLYGLLGIGFSLYLGILEGHIFKRTIAMIMFIYSLTVFVSFLAGKASMAQPFGFLVAKTSTIQTVQKEELQFQVVTSIEQLNEILKKNQGKKIMLDFSAEWCKACQEFDEITFKNPAVISKLKEFVLIRADVTANDEKAKALNQKYGVFGPPVIIFFNQQLQPIKSKTIVGFTEPQKFLEHLNTIY